MHLQGSNYWTIPKDAVLISNFLRHEHEAKMVKTLNYTSAWIFFDIISISACSHMQCENVEHNYLTILDWNLQDIFRQRTAYSQMNMVRDRFWLNYHNSVLPLPFTIYLLLCYRFSPITTSWTPSPILTAHQPCSASGTNTITDSGSHAAKLPYLARRPNLGTRACLGSAVVKYSAVIVHMSGPMHIDGWLW